MSAPFPLPPGQAPGQPMDEVAIVATTAAATGSPARPALGVPGRAEEAAAGSQGGRVGVEQQRLQHWGRIGRAAPGWELLVPRLPLVGEGWRKGPGPSRHSWRGLLPGDLFRLASDPAHLSPQSSFYS